MADKKLADFLKNISNYGMYSVVEWNRIVKGAKIDLSGISLNRVKFSSPNPDVRWNFKGAIFDAAELEQVDFSGAYLGDARFKGAKLVLGCVFDGTDLSNADLSDTAFGACSFKRANFDICDLRRAWLLNSEFDGADVTNADFRDAAIAAHQLATANNVDKCAPHTLHLTLLVERLLEQKRS